MVTENPGNKILRNTELEKPLFWARSSAEVARLFLGATQSQGTKNLWKAAITGCVDRLKVLIEVSPRMAPLDAHWFHLCALHLSLPV